MAILRGGRRIGNFDIRVGIPRDRSLQNVLGDPRLKQRAGGNPESTIGRFMGKVAEGEGFARPNRFLVDFILPSGISELSTGPAGPPGSQDQFVFEEEISRSTRPGQLRSESELQRGLRAFCFNAELPSRNIDTNPFQTYGPKREVAYAYSFPGEITLSFYADKYLRQRTFFEMWQNSIMDQGTHNMHFYDEYVGGIRIYQLGAFSGDAFRDRISYGVELFEAYPKSILAVPFDYANSDIQKISITFQFRNWQNLSLDQVKNYTVGGGFKVPTVKQGNRGFLGNILSKLPPEIRRAGRDAVNVIRQRVPIGSVFGGKVFPPFL